jgi:nucleotide-binding universal stress UspA family protein
VRAPVIVGTDLSEPSYEAVRQAHEWALRRRAPLVVCHVMPRTIPAGTMLRQRVADAIGESVLEARVAERLRKLVGRLTGADVEVVLGEGAPDIELIRAAAGRDARLLVVGSHGQPGLGGLFFGDVAEAVVRGAHRPVLVARPHTPTRHILVGTDFSPNARNALQLAAEEARLRGASLTLLTSIEQYLRTILGMTEFGSDAHFVEREYADERAKAEERLAQELKEAGADGGIIVTDGNPAADLVLKAADLDADLVVVGAVGRGALERLRIGRVAVKVVRHAPCSVLVV